MKGFLTTLLFLILINPLFASNISEKEVSNAFVAITDLGYITAADFISLNRKNFDSIAVRISPSTSLPDAVLFSDADLSFFLPYFEEDDNSNFFSSFLPTIDPFVRERLEINNWKNGEAIVTGAAALVFPNNMTFQQFLSSFQSENLPKVGVSFNFTVSGTLFESDINIKGILIVESDSYGVPTVSPLRLTINNEDYDLSFFERAPLLLTMKNDI
jgi:hypothetical protein